MQKGSLTVVGTGIVSAGQVTHEALSAISTAETLFYLVGDVVTQAWIKQVNQNAKSLYGLYAEGKERSQTYQEIVEHILTAVRAGRQVCAAFYGHPGVFAYPPHEAVRRARMEGFEAVMLPGISAEDCLISDAGFDPGARGCQSYEATDFLLRQRRFDPTSHLILWQICGIGVTDFHFRDLWSDKGLEVLTRQLLKSYPEEHEVVVYEASPYPMCVPKLERVRLCALPNAPVTVRSTLWVPPLPNEPIDPVMKHILGLG